MTATRRNVVVVSAGLAQPSSTRLLADRLAQQTRDALEHRRVEVQTHVVELRHLAHQVTDNLLTGFPGPDLRAVVDTVARADGVIAVSPILNASYSGLFKSFVDVLGADALTGKGVLLGATGGTERHSLALEHALRPLFTHLRAVVVPTSVYAATADFGDAAAGALDERIARGAAELAGVIAQSGAGRAVDPFDQPTPFADLLAR